MIHAVIMAGGSGTRFWPESRQQRPKQLLPICGEQTMLRATVERIRPTVPLERIIVITGQAHAEGVRRELHEIQRDRVVVEPRGLNTAPCVALAAYKLFAIDPDGVMVVLPSDHLIKHEEEFRKAVRVAGDIAASGDYLLTFGIIPDRPETGYGYIKLGPLVMERDGITVHQVERFVEKPDRATAEEYVTSRTYLWNSGMFVWGVRAIIKAIETHIPALARVMMEIAPTLNTPDEATSIEQAYASIDPISIDYGVMEKAANVLTLPIDVGWNDVGSWSSLSDVWLRDEYGNATRGDVVALDTRGCIICSPDKVVTLIGVEDLIVVDTPDALMVCRKDRAQDVRQLQELLKQKGYDTLL